MCHDPAARPPVPPISGGATIAEPRDVVLRARDGTDFGAHSVRTTPAGGAGIVILPDVRGLHPFYKDLAVRFGEAGVHAVAIDYFGRTAGLGERADDFDHMAHVRKTRPDEIALDVAAAVAHARSGEGGGAERVYTVGFCFGGRQSFNQAAAGHGLAGVIGFYGSVAAKPPYPEETAPIRLASTYECAVLGLFGGADRGISREDVEAFRRALDAAFVPNEIVVYEGAPHSFFDRASEDHREACDDAWSRIMRFVNPIRD
jgi:carboxymethylenebutenolidase